MRGTVTVTLVSPETEPPELSAAREASLRRREQLAVLADLATEAVALQPAAQSAVSSCGRPGIVPDTIALELGQLSHAYSLIYERARHLPVDTELTEASAELCRLLSYHLHMLRDAGDLAFSGRVDARTEPFRQELAQGLGPYASALVTLADEYRTRATAPESRMFEGWESPDEFVLDDVELNQDEP